jgi:hypothetical protein
MIAGSRRICGRRSPKRWRCHGELPRQCTGRLVRSRWPAVPTFPSSILLVLLRNLSPNRKPMHPEPSTTTQPRVRLRLQLVLANLVAIALRLRHRPMATTPHLTPSLSKLTTTLYRRWSNPNLSHPEVRDHAGTVQPHSTGQTSGPVQTVHATLLFLNHEQHLNHTDSTFTSATLVPLPTKSQTARPFERPADSSPTALLEKTVSCISLHLFLIAQMGIETLLNTHDRRFCFCLLSTLLKHQGFRHGISVCIAWTSMAIRDGSRVVEQLPRNEFTPFSNVNYH